MVDIESMQNIHRLNREKEEKFSIQYPEGKTETIKDIREIKTFEKKIKELNMLVSHLSMIHYKSDYFCNYSEGYNTHYYNQTRSGNLYKQEAATKLQRQVSVLITALESETLSETVDEKNLLIDSLYIALSQPTTEHCKKLYNHADLLSGKRNFGAQVKIVTLTILGLLCGIIPGLCYVFHNKTQEEWKKSQRNGLSKQTRDIEKSIKKAGASDAIQYGTFFNTTESEKRDKSTCSNPPKGITVDNGGWDPLP